MSRLDLVNSNNRRLAKLKGELYLSITETANKWNVSRSRIYLLLEEGRIPGAYRVGPTWIIPDSFRHKKTKRKYTKTFPQQKQTKKAVRERPAFSLDDPSKS
jgi:excisionase family DNA binding protein